MSDQPDRLSRLHHRRGRSPRHRVIPRETGRRDDDQRRGGRGVEHLAEWVGDPDDQLRFQRLGILRFKPGQQWILLAGLPGDDIHAPHIGPQPRHALQFREDRGRRSRFQGHGQIRGRSRSNHQAVGLAHHHVAHQRPGHQHRHPRVERIAQLTNRAPPGQQRGHPDGIRNGDVGSDVAGRTSRRRLTPHRRPVEDSIVRVDHHRPRRRVPRRQQPQGDASRVVPGGEQLQGPRFSLQLRASPDGDRAPRDITLVTNCQHAGERRLGERVRGGPQGDVGTCRDSDRLQSVCSIDSTVDCPDGPREQHAARGGDLQRLGRARPPQRTAGTADGAQHRGKQDGPTGEHGRGAGSPQGDRAGVLLVLRGGDRAAIQPDTQRGGHGQLPQGCPRANRPLELGGERGIDHQPLAPRHRAVERCSPPEEGDLRAVEGRGVSGVVE